MSENQSTSCPECAADVASPAGLARREFVKVIAGGVAGVMGAGSIFNTRPAFAEPAVASRPAKPAESLVQELYSTLTDDQKKAVVFPWNHGGENNGLPTRLKTFNAPPMGKNLDQQYTRPQQELIRSTLRAILSGDEAYERLARGGKWDGAGSFEGNGVAIFGDPTDKKQFSWVFAGHHLTLRCDGNSQPNAAFGGPMYYGHSANGHSETNAFNYQTKQVMSVFDALDEPQRKKAIVVGHVGDGLAAMKLNPAGARPGVLFTDLDSSQRELVTSVMRTLIGPFRQEDGDEVMQLIKAQGGMEKIQLAFYKDSPEKTNGRWDAWRLEGPGFVWNYRVLPHVHCFVNITGQA